MAIASSSRVADAPSQQRTSSRVRRPPEHFTSSPFTNGSKRKRGQDTDADGDDVMGDADDANDESDSEDEDEDEDEDEPDDEEIRERVKKARNAKRAAPKKPAQKKPKVDSLSLPFRAAKGPPKKRAPRRAVLVMDSADAEAAGGLYAEIFAHNEPAEQVVARWLKDFNEHESRALANVINFVLKSAGCNGKVTEFNIEDPDGATARLTDLQDEHQASEPTEYPLIAKGRNATVFKDRVSGFMHTLIRSLAASDLLYSNPELIENIEVWLSTMSSAANRSFRHTSAVVSLAIISALCEIAREMVEKSSNSQRHAETERKKSRVNKARVNQIEESVKDSNAKLEFLEALLKDWFETVFIHRYRDIDPIIRRDSVAALGDWIVTMPDTFFDGHHLRYLGWVLCDISPATRGEDLKQLRRLYSDKDKLGGLKTFTERFRVRLVEIATADAETSVRIAGIELLDLLRENGLLEPDDIDAVGRLIFHEDVRVRKAVANFFSENVSDLYNSKLDDLGGAEGVEDVLPEIGEGNFSVPRLEWLRYKSLVELFISYDDDEDDILDDALQNKVVRNRHDGSLVLNAAGASSRFTLAADVLCNIIDDLKEWQTLAGYLLVDDSTARTNGTSTQSVLSQLKHECILSEKEVSILLEVLNSSVRITLTELAEKISAPKSKLTQRQKDNLQDEQDEAARNLVELIPKLLKKFGDAPGSAAAVLRLEALMALPAFGSLRQDTATNNVFLEHLSRQYLSHGTDEVLAPAADAILRATSYGDSDETATEKVSALWENIVSSTIQLLDPTTVTAQGTLETDDLLALGNNLLRIVRLGAVMSCIEPLEDNSVAATNTSSGREYNGAIDFLIDLIERAVPSTIGSEPSLQDADLEDRISIRASEAALFYFRWKLLSIMTSITTNSSKGISYEALEALAERRDTYVNHLLQVLQTRRSIDPVSHTAASCLLDLYTSAALLRTVQAPPGSNDDYTVLIMDLDNSHEKAIMKVFTAAEKTFARLSHKKIDDNSDNTDPPVDDIDPDADPASDDYDEDGATSRKTTNAVDDDPIDEDVATTENPSSTKARDAALAKSLLAEQRLCTLASKLIYALAAGIISPKLTRQRLELNRSRLGPNYKEVIAYLDASRGVSTRRGGAAPSTTKSSKPTPVIAPAVLLAKQATKRAHPKSHALVTEDETDDEIEDVDDEDEDNDDPASLRRRELDVDPAPDDDVEDDPPDEDPNDNNNGDDDDEIDDDDDDDDDADVPPAPAEQDGDEDEDEDEDEEVSAIED